MGLYIARYVNRGMEKLILGKVLDLICKGFICEGTTMLHFHVDACPSPWGADTPCDGAIGCDSISRVMPVSSRTNTRMWRTDFRNNSTWSEAVSHPNATWPASKKKVLSIRRWERSPKIRPTAELTTILWWHCFLFQLHFSPALCLFQPPLGCNHPEPAFNLEHQALSLAKCVWAGGKIFCANKKIRITPSKKQINTDKRSVNYSLQRKSAPSH